MANSVKSGLGLCLVVCAGVLVGSQATLYAKDTLGVAAISPTASLAQSVEQAGKSLSLRRVAESLDAQLIDRFNATRKFQIVATSDLKELVQKQELAHSGNYDASDPALPQLFRLAGTKYYLTTTLDDFQDYVEKATFEGTGRSATKRVIRLSCVGKIYETSSGRLLESANFQTGNDAFKDVAEERSYAVKDGELSDAMLVAMSRDMAGKVAERVADVLFPAKVLARRDNIVTINRGDGAGVVRGDVWSVFALGEEMIDPDTKESLGREEVLVGKVKISLVTPMTSQAEILEDLGIAQGALLRKAQ
jgi:hypothetical protein